MICTCRDHCEQTRGSTNRPTSSHGAALGLGSSPPIAGFQTRERENHDDSMPSRGTTITGHGSDRSGLYAARKGCD